MRTVGSPSPSNVALAAGPGVPNAACSLASAACSTSAVVIALSSSVLASLDDGFEGLVVASGGGIVRCRAVKRMTEDRRWLAARFWILPMDTLGSFCGTEGTTTEGTWRCRADPYGCVGT